MSATNFQDGFSKFISGLGKVIETHSEKSKCAKCKQDKHSGQCFACRKSYCRACFKANYEHHGLVLHEHKTFFCCDDCAMVNHCGSPVCNKVAKKVDKDILNYKTIQVINNNQTVEKTLCMTCRHSYQKSECGHLATETDRHTCPCCNIKKCVCCMFHIPPCDRCGTRKEFTVCRKCYWDSSKVIPSLVWDPESKERACMVCDKRKCTYCDRKMGESQQKCFGCQKDMCAQCVSIEYESKPYCQPCVTNTFRYCFVCKLWYDHKALRGSGPTCHVCMSKHAVRTIRECCRSIDVCCTHKNDVDRFIHKKTCPTCKRQFYREGNHWVYCNFCWQFGECWERCHVHASRLANFEQRFACHPCLVVHLDPILFEVFKSPDSPGGIPSALVRMITDYLVSTTDASTFKQTMIVVSK